MAHELSSVEADQPAAAPSLETAGDLMTTAIVSVAIGASVRDVALLLLEKRISAVPVLAPTSNCLEWSAKATFSVATTPIGSPGATGGWPCLEMGSPWPNLLRRWSLGRSNRSCVRPS